MSTHSPGPWAVESGDEGTFVTQQPPNGVALAKVYGLRGNENAALMVAAPRRLRCEPRTR
jgi:hypothetical protein